MSQVIIPPGVKDSGHTVWFVNQPVIVEEISASFNEAIRAINGNLTDVNMRERDLPHGTDYDGMWENYIEFTDTDGIGHNHDGINSAPLADHTVNSGVIDEDEFEFLGVPYTTNSGLTYFPILMSGKLLARFDTTNIALFDELGLSVNVPFDSNVLTLRTSQARVLASTWYVRNEAEPDKDCDQVATMPGVAAVTYGASNDYLRLDFSLKMANLTIRPEHGYFGLQWVIAAEAAFLDPTT